MVGAAPCILCLVLCLCLTAAGDESRPLISPKQLLVGTVIDTTSTEIVRDAINMIKSIRVFGDTFNAATILVGITGELDAKEDSVFHTLIDLDVQLMFIPQSPPSHAKTLNKFRMFEAFDSIKYDYFLWLDADVFVFQDPMPYLHMHMYPGSVECVPDFYSYMRRYPSVNTSAEYWNPEKPSFHLLGAGETAPHGICNTGVLYFDSLSLSKFMAGLSAVLQNETYMDTHGKDRFVDSLIFTKVVNTQNIEVTTLPHSLNYMALFEIEIQEELLQPQVVMAHLLSDTELYCTATAPEINSPLGHDDTLGEVGGYSGGDSPSHDGGAEPVQSEQVTAGCSCVYRNKLLPPKDSLLRDTIQDMILRNVEVCEIFAGVRLPAHWPGKRAELQADPLEDPVAADLTESIGVGTPAERVELGDPGGIGITGRCALVTPPASGAVLRVHSDLTATVPVLIQCAHHAPQPSGATPSPSLGKHSVRNLITDLSSGAIVHDSAVRMELTGAATQGAYTLRFSVPPPPQGGAYVAYYTLQIALSGGAACAVADRCSANLTVVFDHLIPPGQVHYSANPLLSAKPAALESQLYLPAYLNDRQMRGTGVVVCCDTFKGVATVQEIIERWQGEFLLIVLESAPALASAERHGWEETIFTKDTYYMTDLRKKLTNLCAASNGRRAQPLVCYITTIGEHGRVPTFAQRISRSLRPHSAQFVYLDSHQLQITQSWLSSWWGGLTKNGLLMGAQFSAPPRTAVWDRTSGAAARLNPMIGHREEADAGTYGASNGREAAQRRVDVRVKHVSYAAQALALTQAQSLLLTYDERAPAHCTPFATSYQDRDVSGHLLRRMHEAGRKLEEAQAWECLPAWYLHKLRQ